MENTSSPFLNVKNLFVEYTSEGKVIHAVNDISFSLEKGKTLALVGETGAGKTTIAKSIMQILPDYAARITGGQILLEGVDLLKEKESELLKIRGRRISMVFQDPMTALNPIMRIGDQVAEVIREHQKIGKKEAKIEAQKILDKVGIQANRYSNFPHQFSGGMKQRVIIAIALACTPELLIADEPTSALDVTIQAQVLAMMKNLRDEMNTAMILITHDLGVVANIADYVAVVYAGQIVEYGALQDIFLKPMHPYTKALFRAIPDMETEYTRLENIQGFPPDPSDLPLGCYFSPRCSKCTSQCKMKMPDLKEITPLHFCRCFNSEENE